MELSTAAGSDELHPFGISSRIILLEERNWGGNNRLRLGSSLSKIFNPETLQVQQDFILGEPDVSVVLLIQYAFSWIRDQHRRTGSLLPVAADVVCCFSRNLSIGA